MSAQDDPVRALLLIEIEPLAVVAPHALAPDDSRSLDRAPLARLLADPARVAFAPSLDAEDRRRLREDAERGADGTQKPAVEIPDEDRRRQQHAEADPHRRRAEAGEHPERFGVLHRPGEILRRDVVDDDRDEQSILDPRRAPLDGGRGLRAAPP